MGFCKKLIVATTNSGKLREFIQLLEPLNIEVLSLKDFPEIGEIEETGATFIDNALLKARAVARITGYISLADDSGLEVDYLGGLPGVNSARFAGEPKDDSRNNLKLLSLMKGIPPIKRIGRFKCAIAIVGFDQTEYIAQGSCEGFILDEKRGDKGFGYDPLFYVPEYKKTFAELDMETKNKISHRGIAAEKALDILKRIFIDDRP
ncbi:MAG: purine NTP phosphatase [Clostridiaceae bacterium BRH_c20a]|nr:MAG: purine NTP phosphatase [Clostridiaceae bacterium BRH_c20a]